MPTWRTLCSGLAALVLAALAPTPATAAGDRCLAVAEAPLPRLVQKAGVRLAEVKEGDVRITYVGHSTFLIQSAAGIRIATDYNDYVKPSVVPEIVTMNRAHDTHYTNFPEPEIKHVLRGWNPTGGAAEHDVSLSDVRVRNVPTNIRGWGNSDGSNTQYFANSIFVFELAGLCVAHLGHLHHTLNQEQLAKLGQIDVVLVPVDGSFTLDLEGMVEVLKSIRAPLMIPMHYFSRYTLDRFLGIARNSFDVTESAVNWIALSRAKLPQKPQVLVLPGGR